MPRAGKALALALAAALCAPLPVADPARASGSDPNDAYHCVEIIGRVGYSVRINNRCNYVLRLVTCVIGADGRNTCKDPRPDLFPVPANARDHTILDMQVGAGDKYFIVACKDPWTPGNPHMAGGELVADSCEW